MHRDAPTDKAAWRRWARRTRRDLDTGAWSTALVEVLRRWPTYAAASTVASYLAFGSEADLGRLLGDDRVFVVPRVDPAGGPLGFHRIGGALRQHAMGMMEPAADAPRVDPTAIDLVLVPGLAFDRTGVRLGHGAGYYDAWLPLLRPGTPRVGVAHPALVAHELPCERHDVRMTHLLLPGGVVAIERFKADDD
ncbi:MAG: 5-formyltetrahydrofolate cyclo-ligase [Trueperaceae bacterium]|nr:5-formyltetrahydrofolate cyclo-ligase [Trueperaceae bacterium]